MDKIVIKKKKVWTKNRIQLFIMAMFGAAFLIVFAYVPMFGVALAFKDGDKELNILDVLISGKWVGFANFERFFNDYNFKNILTNTLGLNILMLFINFPAPIVFALLIHEIRHRAYQRTVQSIAIFPTFLSWVVFGGILLSLLDMNMGIANPVLRALGIIGKDDFINFGEAKFAWANISISSLLKGTGWSSVIYTAAILGIDPELYEAAKLDGAGRFRQITAITIPSIAPMLTVSLLLSISGLLNNSFEHINVFQNAVNTAKSEVIATYVYKQGISGRLYSYTTAVGLFQSLVALILLASSNFISKKITGRGLY
ncbi:MAG: sugar ABC transporter permease [Clostridia bacterium]|nr:sugar ABC transporter permease [Clostridia bacterium]